MLPPPHRFDGHKKREKPQKEKHRHVFVRLCVFCGDPLHCGYAAPGRFVQDDNPLIPMPTQFTR